MNRWRWYGLLALGIAVACEDQGGAPTLDAAASPDAVTGDAAVDAGDAAGDAAGDVVAGDTTTPTDLSDAWAPDAASCATLGETVCVDPTHQKRCSATGWIVEACTSGTLCLDEACSAECRDQCNQGDTRTSGGTTETCALFSVAKNGPVAPSKTSLHDRARAYNAWLRQHHLPAGGLNVATFTDATLTKVAYWGGTGDSALWTGAYLGAEALRYKATQSPDAQQNMQKVVEYIHRLYTISGHKGYMVRYAAPVKNADPRIDAIYEQNHPDFFKVSYQGTDWFYRGGTSRDAYQGPLLGLALAYEQLTSEPHRQMIREAMVDLCMELIKDRKGVKITVTFYLNGAPITLPFNADLQYVVLNPTEFVGGGPAISIGSAQNPTDYTDSSTLEGIREFFPDYSVFLKQVPLLGALITFPVPRSGSTIMLSSILRIGMLVTKGVPAYATQHAAISAHYNANIQSWLGIMKLYLFTNAQCWEKYYGLNIGFMPVYNLIRMEPDATLKAAFQNDVLAGKMWPYVKNHKNVFFSYIYASHAASATTQGVINQANKQLAMFPAPPNVDRDIDNTGKYPASTKCEGQTSVAIDTSDRRPEYFAWQKHPFYLQYDGNPQTVWPGVDYLLPYWMGRVHGFLTDDAAGTCLRWQP
jgi:hypothetical protein